VHAIPIIPSRGCKPPSPARFDTVFAVEDWSQYQGPLNIQGPLWLCLQGCLTSN
jgi:hypothetical protein